MYSSSFPDNLAAIDAAGWEFVASSKSSTGWWDMLLRRRRLGEYVRIAVLHPFDTYKVHYNPGEEAIVPRDTFWKVFHRHEECFRIVDDGLGVELPDVPE